MNSINDHFNSEYFSLLGKLQAYICIILLINHYVAWLINTCLFGFFNFVLIRWLAFPPELDDAYLERLSDD